jgi:hypothetical protein
MIHLISSIPWHFPWKIRTSSNNKVIAVSTGYRTGHADTSFTIVRSKQYVARPGHFRDHESIFLASQHNPDKKY